MLSKLSKKFAGWMHPGEVEKERLEAMVGPPGVWNESRDFQIQFLQQRGLKKDNTVLDVGCGPLRGGVPLISHLDKGMYVGIDVREEVIEEAKKQVKKNGLVDKSPRLFVSTTFGQECLGDECFDVVWCFQVLYHLTDELTDMCFARIASMLQAGGVCYCNVNIEGEEGKWKEFPYLKRPLDFYQGLAVKHGLNMSNLGQLKDFGYTTKVPGQFNHMLELRTNSKGS